jgi:hypothetical protein
MMDFFEIKLMRGNICGSVLSPTTGVLESVPGTMAPVVIPSNL